MTRETHPIEKEQVMPYLDGELSANAAKAVAVHIDQCAECRESAEDLRVISSRMLAWSIEPASKRLGETVLGELANGEVRKPHWHTPQKWPGSGLWKRVLQSRWTWATAGVVAVVACFFAVSPELLVMHKADVAPARSQQVVTKLSRESSDLVLNASKIAGESNEEKENQISIGLMIARTASLNISVKDFSSARTSVSRIVAAHKGYVALLSISSQNAASQTLTAKLAIPAAQCDAALAELKGLGRVAQEQQGGEEGTSQVVELDVRFE